MHLYNNATQPLRHYSNPVRMSAATLHKHTQQKSTDSRKAQIAKALLTHSYIQGRNFTDNTRYMCSIQSNSSYSIHNIWGRGLVRYGAISEKNPLCLTERLQFKQNKNNATYAVHNTHCLCIYSCNNQRPKNTLPASSHMPHQL